MNSQDSVLVSNVPMLKPNEFEIIKQYMLLTDYGLWEVVEHGPSVPEPAVAGAPPKSDADKKRKQTEMKALSTLLLVIPNEYQHQFCTCPDAKSLWNALEKRFSGTKSSKRNQKALLKQQYENFTSTKNASMTQTFDRFNKLIGELANVDVKMEKDEVNRKLLRSLSEEWTMYTVSFRQGDDLEDKELEDLYNDLRIFEVEVEAKRRPTGYSHTIALYSSENPSSNINTASTANTNPATSRPDIMFAVCVCARFQVRPKESHLHAVKRIFKYLKGQPKLGLWYPNDSSFDLVAYTDSDYGGANLDRKSTLGGCQFLGGRLVSWQCKKQTTVSQSTTEAEYIAASQCCSQVLWIQNQMQDYGLSFLQTPIYIDNNSAISIVNNPVKHSKTKHIEIKYHLIRDCNEKKLIQVQKVHTDDQYADLFTKAFDVGRFIFLVTSVGMMNSE
ncbi:hypothetical protein OSB04_031954 [Centaurea solstitialis]|uniref:Uncharacterized protein n=1 Tax=Centaurea solstitialis TaxID=347529 RepID=A0AA38SNP6_9ASTR|nr:hypothetical protein OSB04_031954 [Centaurea solstitialis]